MKVTMSGKNEQETVMRVQAALEDGRRIGFRKGYWAGVASVDILFLASVALFFLALYV